MWCHFKKTKLISSLELFWNKLEEVWISRGLFSAAEEHTLSDVLTGRVQETNCCCVYEREKIQHRTQRVKSHHSSGEAGTYGAFRNTCKTQFHSSLVILKCCVHRPQKYSDIVIFVLFLFLFCFVLFCFVLFCLHSTDSRTTVWGNIIKYFSAACSLF